MECTTIRRDMLHAPRGSQRCDLSEDIVLMGPHHIRHDEARAMSHGMPAPALWRVLLDNAPPFVTFCFFHWRDLQDDGSGLPRLAGESRDGAKRRCFVCTLHGRGWD